MFHSGNFTIGFDYYNYLETWPAIEFHLTIYRFQVFISFPVPEKLSYYLYQKFHKNLPPEA